MHAVAPATRESTGRTEVRRLSSRSDKLTQVANGRFEMSKQRTGGRPRPAARARGGGIFPDLGNPHLLSDSLQSGLKKLEDVFDERVATALHRLGIPSAKTVERLERRMEELAAQMQALQRARSKK